MIVSRRGYTFSLVLILLIIGVACGLFYLTNNSNSIDTVALSPQNDGWHLECVSSCINSTEINSTCSATCRYAQGEGSDQCDPVGSVCILN